ncbi:adenosylcobinamide-phosphate synthase [Clostridium cavendishii DSM 21758]|uniref:Cobalamin biosynthesis protein CobD n=1 Tax=Clostridium cavendishii DSM 21758 TaxID=1121302 RepID=A0A1M6T8Y1_9CLOT|nr:adenosylcobinamide-phosphate synthase CbiB [Clostridium cavendishii]SHK53299.1 adenosylcobinamide-phosphate synthase [Clostridium cavendishii DSM 21758]
MYSIYIIDILLAFLLDCILGDPYNFPHPVRFIGKFIRFFEKQIRKKERSKKALRYFYGPLLGITTVLATFFIVYFLLKLAFSINIYLYHFLNVIILWTSIAPRCLANEGYKVYKALKDEDVDLARERVSYLVSRDTKSLDEEGITRATVETILENVSDGIIAPMFFIFIFGAPLALVYKAINTLDSMVGYKNEKYEDLGFFSAKLDDLVNFIPARLSGLLISVASLLLGFNFRNSFKVFFRDRLKHKSPNSAHPEAAGAGALNIRLGGPNYYFGKIVEKPYIGDEIEKVNFKHILSSIKLLYGSTILMLLIGVIVYL